MFRLTQLKMNSWCMAAGNINKAAVAAADKSTKVKKDKPNPC